MISGRLKKRSASVSKTHFKGAMSIYFGGNSKIPLKAKILDEDRLYEDDGLEEMVRYEKRKHTDYSSLVKSVLKNCNVFRKKHQRSFHKLNTNSTSS